MYCSGSSSWLSSAKSPDEDQSCLGRFELRVFILLDWLPTKAMSYYLPIAEFREEDDSYLNLFGKGTSISLLA